MNNPKFQLFNSSINSQYYYRLRASNGEIVLNGEAYTSKHACLNGIVSVKQNAPYDINYERKNSSSSYTFNLKAANGEIIGRRENYTSVNGREIGIAAVKKDAHGASVEDL